MPQTEVFKWAPSLLGGVVPYVMMGITSRAISRSANSQKIYLLMIYLVLSVILGLTKYISEQRYKTAYIKSESK